MLEIDIPPRESEQFTLPQACRCRQENEGAFLEGEVVDQCPDLRGGQHN
jgi:hypothetical protein